MSVSLTNYSRFSFRSSQLLAHKVRRTMASQSASVQSSTVVSVHRRPESYVAEKKPVNIIAVGDPLPPREREALEKLPSGSNMVAIGCTPDEFSSLTEKDWKSIEVILVTTRSVEGIEEVASKAQGVKWIHSLSAGINHLTVPSVQALNVPVTNAKGVFSHSLGEYCLFACNYFAKDLPRLLEAKKAKKWDVFEVEELRGRTMGIVGLGDIGFATAKIAKVFGMKIIGLRRNIRLTEDEKSVIDEVYGPEELTKVMGMSDYVVVALPLTANTKGFVHAAAIEAMQPHGVFINVGRGPTVDESALTKALQEKRIRGAALDVFEVEPLPKTSPLYELDNVLISSHNADKTSHFITDSIDLFWSLVKKYMVGEELENLVDIKQGY